MEKFIGLLNKCKEKFDDELNGEDEEVKNEIKKLSESFSFYIRNLIIPISSEKKTEAIIKNIELLIEIEEIFKKDKKLILIFLRYLREKDNNKQFSAFQVTKEALDFVKKQEKK